MTMKTDERNKFAIKSFLGEYLDLKKDKDNELETVDSIRKGVEFKGANLWILIFAIFMASLGLNVNSTAVIIGAMLIWSPSESISFSNSFKKSSSDFVGISVSVSVFFSPITEFNSPSR